MKKRREKRKKKYGYKVSENQIIRYRIHNCLHWSRWRENERFHCQSGCNLQCALENKEWNFNDSPKRWRKWKWKWKWKGDWNLNPITTNKSNQSTTSECAKKGRKLHFLTKELLDLKDKCSNYWWGRREEGKRRKEKERGEGKRREEKRREEKRREENKTKRNKKDGKSKRPNNNLSSSKSKIMWTFPSFPSQSRYCIQIWKTNPNEAGGMNLRGKGSHCWNQKMEKPCILCDFIIISGGWLRLRFFDFRRREERKWKGNGKE